MKIAAVLTVLVMSTAAAADAQWLTRRTPNTPRKADGTPDLAAPAPRGPDGKPDLSGIWQTGGLRIPVPDDALTAQSRSLLRERQENYKKDRPSFQCRPSGPELLGGWRRVVQGPNR
jgi:hypothetical protein